MSKEDWGKLKARMIDWAELAPEVRQINFEVLGDEPFVFTPGQFVSVIEKHQGREVIRPYSIASPRDGRRFSLCLNRVSEGIVSPYLFALEPNDEVEIGQPLGYFTLRHPDHRAVMIATGTGIAPFRSMLAGASAGVSSSGSTNGSSGGPEHLATTVTLLFGARVEENLLYRVEMEHLARTHPRFRFIPTLTRPSSSWSGRIGARSGSFGRGAHRFERCWRSRDRRLYLRHETNGG